MPERTTASYVTVPRRKQALYLCECGSIWRNEELAPRICERCRQHPVKQAAGWDEAADP